MVKNIHEGCSQTEKKVKGKNPHVDATKIFQSLHLHSVSQ